MTTERKHKKEEEKIENLPKLPKANEIPKRGHLK
jgi:hypothetical protein